MELIKKLCLLFLGLAVYTESPVFAKVVDLDTASWSGVSFYIPVSAQAVKDKVESFNQLDSGANLYLSETLPEGLSGLPENTFPLYFEFGTITVDDSVEGYDINPSAPEMTVAIPFLSLTEGGPAHASLNLAIFHDSSRANFPEYALIPYTLVDMELDGDELSITSGTDEIRIKYTLPLPCIPEDNDIAEEFQTYMNEDVSFSPVSPTFDYCTGMQSGDQFCQKVDGFREEVLEEYPDVCAHWQSDNGKSCEASVEEITIAGFQDIIPGTQDEAIQVLAAEGYIGDFDVKIKYPCV